MEKVLKNEIVRVIKRPVLIEKCEQEEQLWDNDHVGEFISKHLKGRSGPRVNDSFGPHPRGRL